MTTGNGSVVLGTAGAGATVNGATSVTLTAAGSGSISNGDPNSQITTVANQNRDFSVTTINISVDFSAHPDKVIALLKKVSSEVRQDPAYKDIFLGDPQVLGVDQVKGSEVIYPISIKTLARKQFDAQRELQRRIRIALEENHILPGSPFRVPGGSSITTPGERPEAAQAATDRRGRCGCSSPDQARTAR